MSGAFDKRVLVIQHTAHAHAATIPAALAAAGAAADLRRLFAGDPLPAPAEFDTVAGLIVLGGAMNTDQQDEYPWLSRERELLVAAVRRGLPLLGICLGAQQLARAFGGRVYQRETPEVGWTELEIVARDPLLAGIPSPVGALEWHAQSFSAPPGAVVLALRAGDVPDPAPAAGGGQPPDAAASAPPRPASPPAPTTGEVLDVQAFRLGRRAWGLQFHPEVDAPMLDAWLEQDNKGLRQRDPALWQATHDARHDIVRRSTTLCRTLIANFVATF